MMIISECPRCHTEFMYDPKNCNELKRLLMPLNTGTLGLSAQDLIEQDETIVICQECHEIEMKSLLGL